MLLSNALTFILSAFILLFSNVIINYLFTKNIKLMCRSYLLNFLKTCYASSDITAWERWSQYKPLWILFIKLSYSLLLLFMTDLQVINHMFYEFDQTDGDFHERYFFFWFIHLNSKKDFKIQMKIFESKQTL